MHVGIKRIYPLDLVEDVVQICTDTEKMEVCRKTCCQLESTIASCILCGGRLSFWEDGDAAEE